MIHSAEKSSKNRHSNVSFLISMTTIQLQSLLCERGMGMKNNRFAAIVVLAMFVAALGAVAVFADDSSATEEEENTSSDSGTGETTPSVNPASGTITTKTEITEDATLGDTTFNGGYFVVKDGKVLTLPSKLTLKSENTDGKIIVFEKGSSVSIGGTESKFETDTEIILKGSLTYDTSIDTTAKKINITVDLSSKGTFGAEGFSITGGEDKEIIIQTGVDSSGKVTGYTFKLNIPELSYKGDYEGSKIEYTASSVTGDVYMDANGKIKGASGDSATIKVSKLTMKADNDGNKVESTLNDAQISFSGSQTTGESGDSSLAIVMNVKSGTSLTTATGEDGEKVEMKSDGAEMEAKLTISNQNSKTTMKIEGASGDKATIRMKETTVNVSSSDKTDGCDIKMIISDLSIDLSASIDENGKFKLDAVMKIGSASSTGYTINDGIKRSIESGMSGIEITMTISDKVVVTADMKEISFKGDLGGFGDLNLDIDELKVDNIDVKFSANLSGSSIDNNSAELKVEFDYASVKGSSEYSNDLSLEIRDFAMNYDGKSFDATAKNVSGKILYPTEMSESMDFSAEGLKIDDEETITATKIAITINYASGEPGSISVEDIVIDDDGMKGKYTITDMREDFDPSLALRSDAIVTINDSYLKKLEIPDGAKVSGTVMFLPGSEGISIGDEELSFDESSRGAILKVTLKDSKIESAELILKEGYESIPEWSSGVKYSVDKSGETATLESFDGEIHVRAIVEEYEISFGNAKKHAGLGETVDLGESVAEPGYVFVGWFDGIRFVPAGQNYTVTVPGDRTLAPLFEIADKKYKADSGNYILDIGDAQHAELSTADVSKIVSDMSKNGTERLEIRNALGSVLIDLEDLRNSGAISVSLMSFVPQDEAVSDAVGDRIAFDIASNTVGKNPVCNLKYKLESGESVDSIKVYSVNQYGRSAPVNSTVTDNKDGTATISFSVAGKSADTLSGYYVTAEGESSSDDDGGISPVVIAGIAIAVIAIAIIAFLFLKKRNQGSI